MPYAVTLNMPDGKFGPAMEKLNPRQRAFVLAMLDMGGAMNHTAAARAAGYSDTGGADSGIRVAGHRLAHDIKIQAAIREEAGRRMNSGAIMAASVLIDIAANPVHKDQLKAATQLLDRAGLNAVTEHKITVDHLGGDDRELLQRVKTMAKELGIDPEKLLGTAGLTDVDFEVVGGAAPITEPTDDLEDLL